MVRHLGATARGTSRRLRGECTRCVLAQVEPGHCGAGLQLVGGAAALPVAVNQRTIAEGITGGALSAK